VETFKALRAGDPEQMGPYRIVGRLGSGGMGTVYLGRSPGGRAVAVKVVRPELAEDTQFRRRFVREVSAIRRVNGAFTAGVIDAEPEGEVPWLATVYVPGTALNDAVAEHGPWPAESVLALGAGLAEALGAIHSAGVVHRDLKPSNILLSPDGPRVIDFGISVLSEASALTQTGMMVGTAGFMSPEQLTGGRIGPASDVFSLGAVLTFTATGTGPFGTGTAHMLHYRTVHEKPELDRLPAALLPLMDACLAKEPERRPSVANLVRQLSGALSGDGTTTPPPAPPPPTPPTPSAPDWLPEPVATALRRRPPAPDSASGPDSLAAPAEPPLPSPITAGPTTAAGSRTGVTRRRALFGLAGVATATAGAVGYGVWQYGGTDDDNPSSADGSGGATGGGATTGPGTRRWKISVVTDGANQTAAVPVVADGLVYVAGRKNLYAVTAAKGTKQWTYATGANDGLAPRLAMAAKSGTICLGVGGALHAVQKDSGKRKWTIPAQGGEYAVPAVAGTSVYVVGTSWATRTVYAASTSDGEERWRSAPPSSGDPFTLGPAVAAGMVCVGRASVLYALDSVTGDVKWEYSKDDYAFTDLTVAGETAYLSTTGNAGKSYTLHAVSLKTGNAIWEMGAGGSTGEALGPPVVAGKLVYTSSSSGTLYALNTETGRTKWGVPLAKALTPPAIAGGVAYVVGDGTLYALDAKTGRRKWRHATKDKITARPVVADGTAYINSASGFLYAIAI
jgi:eukaryotic-like serine/threonine-protein kinase